MALDGIYLHHICKEIEDRVLGGRVDKIYQPNKDELVIAFRTREEACKLLISARAGTARVNFTEIALENPKQPPMLCMLLRKRLLSSKLMKVYQKGLERAIYLVFDSVNELGDHVELTLAAEIMGKYSNIILIEDGKIIDALKRVDAEMSSERLVFPGLLYRDPPPQDKLCILEHEPDEIISAIKALPKVMSLAKALMATVQGISPIVSRELEHLTGKGTELSTDSMTAEHWARLSSELAKLKDCAVNVSGKPYTVLDLKRKPMDLSFIRVYQYGASATVRKEESFSALLDRFYAERDRIDRMRVKSYDLLKLLTNKSERISRKINNQRAELDECANKDNLRLFGDLINSNLYAVPKGAVEAELMNYYDEACPMVKVKLDPALNPGQNAQKYYKEYRKAKTAEIKLVEQIELGMKELEYVDTVFYALAEAETEKDLNEIRAELIEQGYMRQRSGRKQMREAASKPLSFVSPGGFTILVGRNNRQNDKLTLKDAAKNDLWFHTKNIPGSHTILVTNGAEPGEEDMRAAAVLAAKHSKAKESAQVPVDYTKARYVSKPQGAKPGMVIYVNQKTVYVDPNE